MLKYKNECIAMVCAISANSAKDSALAHLYAYLYHMCMYICSTVMNVVEPIEPATKSLACTAMRKSVNRLSGVILRH